jgi:hypothetical protein
MSPGDRMAGSVPGLLDTLSCGSTADISYGDREASIPQIVQACFRHLENFGLHTLGIFRVSSSKKRVRQVCDKEPSDLTIRYLAKCLLEGNKFQTEVIEKTGSRVLWFVNFLRKS